jgi:peptidase E
LPGSIALCGGNEFDPASIPFSKAILRLTGTKQPHVVIVPVAATDNPRKAARAGVGHFNSIGARTESIMVVNRETAQDSMMSASIETADVVYLSDGNPLDAVEALVDSEALLKLRHYWESGTILAASGAGAMILGDVYWDSGIWEKGLGMIKNLAVFPHHQFVVGRYSNERLREGLSPDYTIVIITGQEARVIGPDIVTVYAADGLHEYEDGQRFTLSTALT